VAQYTAQIEMHTQNVDETNVRIMGLLRDALIVGDEWDELDEGTWQEYALPGGVNYAPDFDVAVPSRENEEEYVEVVMLTEEQVTYWEDRVYDLGGQAYADGEQGMYFVRLD
jgi:hypothetical protein